MPVGQVRLRFIPGGMISITHANYNWDGNSTSGNDPNQTVDVGQYASNSWGFFDMHGNVKEWVDDWHATYSWSILPDRLRARIVRWGGS